MLSQTAYCGQSPTPHAAAGVPAQRWQKEGDPGPPLGIVSQERADAHVLRACCLPEIDFLFEKEELIFNWEVVQFNVLFLLFIII